MTARSPTRFPGSGRVFQDLITRFDLAPVSADELEGLRGLSGREIMARLKMPMWKLPAISRDMRRRKLAAAGEISLFRRRAQIAGRLAAPRHPDCNRQFGQRSIGPARARPIRGADHPLRLRRLGVRQAPQVPPRGTAARDKPADTICIGDELRDIEAARAAGMDSGAVAWGYALPAALQAAGPTHFFNSIEEMTQRLSKC